MIEFLSEENIELHKGYYRTLKCKFSILEKSDARLQKKALSELYKLSLPKALKEEAIALKREIYLHELYFSSFSKNPKNLSLPTVNSAFGSFQGLLFEAFSLAKDMESGFLLLCESKGRLSIMKSDAVYQLPHVILALDLAEHAYFLDYRFKKEEYIRAALSFWDGEKIKQK